MPDDFNPFDDDSLLPDWMKDEPDESEPDAASEADHGLPPASEWAREPGRTRSSGSAEDDLRRDALSDLPWLNDDLSSEPEPDDALLDDLLEEWGNDAASLDERLGGSPSPAPAAPAASDEDLDWLSGLRPASDAPAEPAPSATGALPDWLAGMALPSEPPASPEMPAPEVSASWLQDETFSAVPEFQAGDLTPPSGAGGAPASDEGLPWPDETDFGLLNALRDAASEEAAEEAPAPGALPDWLHDAQPPDDLADENARLPEWMQGSAAPPPEPEIPGWVQPPAGPPASEALVAGPSAGTDLPAWVLDADESQPEQRVTPGLTFDAWEEQENEAQREAQKTPEDHLLEEVPDWFSGLGGQPPPAPPAAPEEQGAQEFVPSWYLGLEEQDVEEAPDWFQQIDYSGDALAQPAPEVPAAPAGPSAPGGDVPDWFMGLNAPGTGDIDWSALGAPGEEEPHETSPLKRLTPQADHEPAAPELATPRPFAVEPPEQAPEAPPAAESEPEAEADLAALFGAEPQPEGDLAALFGVEIEPELSGEAEAAFPGAEKLAGPEDIPFPDLELDQEMPTGDTDEILEEWMAEFVTPEAAEPEPEGDFVERFDPAAETSMLAPLDEDAPDWLSTLEEGEEPARATSEQQAVPAAPGSAESGLDWLSGISSEDIVPEPEAASAAPDVQGAYAPEASQDADAVDIDRLLSLYTPPPESAPEPEPVELAAQDELPAELRLEEPPDVWEIFGTPDPHASEEGAEPNFEALLDDAALPTVDDLFPLPPGHEPAPEAEGATPPGTPPDFEAALPTEPPLPEPPIAETFQPDWVAEMRPTDLPVTVRAGGIAVDVEQRAVVDLPDQLQVFRETTLRDLSQPPQPAPAPESGPLAGIAGALAPLDLAIPRTVAPVTGLTVTRDQQARADRLRRMLDAAADEEAIDDDLREPVLFGSVEDEAEAVEALPPRVRRRRARRFKLDRVLIALALLAGLIAPFATDMLHFAADPPALSGDRQAVADAVSALDAGDYVLVALEYGPTAAGELDPLVEAVLRDVLAHRAIPLTTGTGIAGALHAQAVIAPLVADGRLLAARNKNETALEPGQDYYLLGYIPGDATGVRALRGTDEDHPLALPSPFVTGIDGEATDLDLDVPRDVALIVVAGESSEDVRTWAEQMGGAGVPMVALVTAAIEPLAASYVNDDGYAGYLAGYRDTRSYDAARNAETRTPYTPPDDLGFDLPDLDAAQWNSTALGAAVAAGLIALGMILNLFRALVRRGRQ